MKRLKNKKEYPCNVCGCDVFESENSYIHFIIDEEGKMIAGLFPVCNLCHNEFLTETSYSKIIMVDNFKNPKSSMDTIFDILEILSEHRISKENEIKLMRIFDAAEDYFLRRPSAADYDEERHVIGDTYNEYTDEQGLCEICDKRLHKHLDMCIVANRQTMYVEDVYTFCYSEECFEEITTMHEQKDCAFGIIFFRFVKNPLTARQDIEALLHKMCKYRSSRENLEKIKAYLSSISKYLIDADNARK